MEFGLQVKDTLFSVLKPIYKREIQAGSSFKVPLMPPSASHANPTQHSNWKS